MITNILSSELPATDVLADFSSRIKGRIIERNDADYDEVRSVYNGMIDKKPLLIVQCTGTADIVASVNFARKNKLLTAVRGGGKRRGTGNCG